MELVDDSCNNYKSGVAFKLLDDYFTLYVPSYKVIIVSYLPEDYTEDGWVTIRKKGKLCRFVIRDDDYYGTEPVSGGSYEFVKHFSDSTLYEVHHVIPVKLLECSGLLGIMEGPAIKLEKEDHAKTRSYKVRYMPKKEYFIRQLNSLKQMIFVQQLKWK